ncbi:MAG: site-2 protease family protein [Nitrospirota bacterium]|nr:site-2 protease family protein [Nitrospirota bacterium]
MDSLPAFLHNLSFMLVPLMVAIVLHEYAHGRVAHFFGDPTAKSLGRLTLNPLPHIDLYGSIIVPLILFLIPGGFIFGWAKPVPINAGKLHNPKRDMALVAIAGPLMNLCLAVISGLLLALFLYIDPTLKDNWPPQPGVEPRQDLQGMLLVPLTAMALFSMLINIVLFAFNLLPIPPLDGSRVLISVLPPKPAMALSRLEPYGMLVVLGLIMVNSHIPILSMYIGSIQQAFFQIFLSEFLS